MVQLSLKTKDGFSLGQWIGMQRRNKGKLSSERIERLNALNFVWNIIEFQWEQGFLNLKKYFEKYGHIRVLLRYKTKDGYKLGNWVIYQR